MERNANNPPGDAIRFPPFPNLVPRSFAPPPPAHGRAYNLAQNGPTATSGNGQPDRWDDGNAHYDYHIASSLPSSPTNAQAGRSLAQTITIPSDPISEFTPPAAGRSPQDSRMNSPESEELTIPAILTETTQVGPGTLLAINAALGDHAPNTDITQVGPSSMMAIDAAMDALQAIPPPTNSSQALWSALNTPPPAGPPNATFPPQPGMTQANRPDAAASTPRVRSRAASNASLWSHVTQESVSESHSPRTRAGTLEPDPNRATELDHALDGGNITPPFDPSQIDGHVQAVIKESQKSDDLWAEHRDNQQALLDEFVRDIPELMIGYANFYLKSDLPMRNGHSFPLDQDYLNLCFETTLTALDAGTALKDGETAVTGLTPQAWYRLVMASLSSIIRGMLRSPAYVKAGTKSLNFSPDSFIISNKLDRPLTEGGAVMLMAQQLAGMVESNRNHPDKSFPKSYYERQLELLKEGLRKAAEQQHKLDQMHAPTNANETEATVKKEIYELTKQEMLSDLRLRAEIQDKVREELYKTFQEDACRNIEEWRLTYHRELMDALRQDVANSKIQTGTDKGKSKAPPPPVTMSQALQEAEPAIRAEVRRRVEEEKAGISGESIRKQLISEMQERVRAEVELLAPETRDFEIDQARKEFYLRTAIEEYNAGAINPWLVGSPLEAILLEARDLAVKKITADNHDLHVAHAEEIRKSVNADIKEWKKDFPKGKKLHFLKREAALLGWELTPKDEDAFRGRRARTTESEAIRMDLELASPTPSRTSSRAPSVYRDTPSTPPRLITTTTFTTRPDPNVTPTPTRVKRQLSHRARDTPRPTTPPALSTPLSAPLPNPHGKGLR
ncbi:hypothetical protein H4582DRAFT_2149692 [Lactarius indigo]|nr:hypothetical protein H4582DRAFT_2149692 [Lactarius indigo]